MARTLEFNRHWRFTCDACSSDNTAEYRYKCLRCEDYNLCADCFKKNVLDTHLKNHPFQCLWDFSTRQPFFNEGEILNGFLDSFTCPLCGVLGYSHMELMKHVKAEHKNELTSVICPICASVPGARPPLVQNFGSHLKDVHEIGLKSDVSSSSQVTFPVDENNNVLDI